MQIPMLCTYCEELGLDGSKSISNVELNDNGRYKLICQNGHSSIVILNHQKFQILFEIGINAIIDGYYREAVSSFTSSLERFYEFFSKVMCITRGINWAIIQDTWKSVSNQSERQLGAFIFLHLLENGYKPVLLNQKNTEFRNAVIHKGKIPSKEEAILYGQAVLNVIRPLLISLRVNYEHSTDELVGRNLRESRGTEDQGMRVVSITKSLILSLDITDPDFYQMSLNDAIDIIKSSRPIY
jgi:hypothetical protein